MARGRSYGEGGRGTIPADVDDNDFEKGLEEGNAGGEEEETGPQVRKEPTEGPAARGRGSHRQERKKKKVPMHGEGTKGRARATKGDPRREKETNVEIMTVRKTMVTQHPERQVDTLQRFLIDRSCQRRIKGARNINKTR